MKVHLENYSITYQNDALHSYMVIKLDETDKLIDYQVKIIKENPSQNILGLHRKQFDDEVLLYYDITSKITLEQFLTRRKLSRYELLTIIKNFIKSLQTGKLFLLQGGKFILDIRCIYINPSSLESALAYIPVVRSADIKEELRAFLMDLIIYKVVFESPEEGSFVYRLLNLLKSDGFSIEKLDKLVFDIAVDLEQTGDEMLSISQIKEMAPGCDYMALREEKNQAEIKKNWNISGTSKSKLFIFILIQLSFGALALLLMRLIAKQNNALDMYSIFGVFLLILGIDFLTIKKMKLLKKQDIKHLRERDGSAAVKESLGSDRKNMRKGKQSENHQRQLREKYLLDSDNLRQSLGADMETSVLTDKEAAFACLLGCGDNFQEKIILEKSDFIIGRMKNQVDYVAQNGAIGKVHAEIINRDGKHYIKDLNSRNGTFINGERIVSNVEYIIKNNDRVTLADSEYKFLWSEGAS